MLRTESPETVFSEMSKGGLLTVAVDVWKLNETARDGVAQELNRRRLGKQDVDARRHRQFLVDVLCGWAFIGVSIVVSVLRLIFARVPGWSRLTAENPVGLSALFLMLVSALISLRAYPGRRFARERVERAYSPLASPRPRIRH